MKHFIFTDCRVRVVNCPFFRVAEVYDITGKLVHEIRTHAYGVRAAKLAVSDARRFRLI